MRAQMESDLKHSLDQEDQKRQGLIGETYEKLNELLQVKKLSQLCIEDNSLYCEEVDQLSKRWEGKTRQDCKYIEERVEKLRHHIKVVDEAVAKNDIQVLIEENMRRAGELGIHYEPRRVNFHEIDEELIKSQRSYNQGLQEALLHLSPPKIQEALVQLGTPPSIAEFDKVRVMFSPFNQVYEYQHFSTVAQHDLLNDLVPLLEGCQIYLTKNRPLDNLEALLRNERLLRLTPDLQKLEIR